MNEIKHLDFTPFADKLDRNGIELAAVADSLTAAGLNVLADAATVTPDTTFTGKTELAVKLGVNGRVASNGQFAYLVALDTPASGTEAGDAFESEVENASCGPLFERLLNEWNENLPNGGRRYFMTVIADSDNDFKSVIRTLPSRSARYSTLTGAQTVGQLHFAKTAVVAPTTTDEGVHRAHQGTAGQPKPVTASELFGLGVVLDQVSESRDRLARGIFDIRAHDARTVKVRDRFNRNQAAADMVRLIVQHGWEQATDSTFATEFVRGNEYGQLVKDTLTFVDGGASAETLEGSAVAYRPFDLLLGLTMPVGKGAERLLTTAEEAATWLAESGQMSADIELAVARGDIPVVASELPTLEIVRAMAGHVQAARTKSEAGTPLAFRRVTNGASDGIISVATDGTVTRWTDRNIVELLYGASQFASVRELKDGKGKLIKPLHSIPPAITASTKRALEGDQVLKPVEYLASEPIITREGKLVSQPGYDLATHAFLTIPHRDRAKWRDEYRVASEPTLEDVRSAYENLDRELLSDFPFADARDRARAMVYLLTCVGRSLTNGSIAFLFNAVDRGSGKTLLSILGRLLAQGSPRASSFRFGKVNDDATEKQLVSMLLAGGTFFHCDETPRNKGVNGDVVTGLITGVDGDEALRILGVSDTVARGGVIVTACGQQVLLGGDMIRRFLRINLAYSGKGSVLARTGFRHGNIIEFVRDNRPKLLGWAHTILLYGAQHSPAHKLEGLGLSHDWVPRILGAATHVQLDNGLTLAQMALNGWLDDVDAGDENSDDWGSLLEHLWKKAVGKQKTAAELASLSISVNKQNGEQRPDLPPVLLGVSPRDPSAGKRWATELRAINGTRVPWNGVAYRLEKVERGTASKKSGTYIVTCFDAEGDEVIAGRDPHAVKAIEADTAAAMAEAADFS